MKKLMMIAAMMIAAVTVNAQVAGKAYLKPMVGATRHEVWSGGRCRGGLYVHRQLRTDSWSALHPAGC